MKTIVIYRSEKGYTKRYAKMISDHLNADLLELDKLTLANLDNYDTVIFGAGIYSSKINGIDLFINLIREKLNKNVIVFGVGMSPVFKEYTARLYKENIENKLSKDVKFFFLRGGVDLNKLSNIERKVLVAFLKITEIFQESYTEVTSNSKATDDVLDFYSQDFTKELIEFVEGIKQ